MNKSLVPEWPTIIDVRSFTVSYKSAILEQVIYSSWYGMDMNKQAKAKTTFDNIIIYVHEPTVLKIE